MHATLVCGHYMHGHIYNKYVYVIYKISIYIFVYPNINQGGLLILLILGVMVIIVAIYCVF